MNVNFRIKFTAEASSEGTGLGHFSQKEFNSINTIFMFNLYMWYFGSSLPYFLCFLYGLNLILKLTLTEFSVSI